MHRVVAGLLLLVASTGVSSLSAASDRVTISVFETHDLHVAASRTYGVSWRLLEAAAADQGITLHPVENSWRASLTRLQGQKIDLVYSAVYTEDRAKWAYYSLPIHASGSAIFTHKSNQANSLQDIDLQTASIGVSANSVQEEFAKDLGFQNIYATTDRFQLHKMLQLNRLDYLFFSVGVVDYYCVHIHISGQRECLKQIGDYYNYSTVHVIALKGDKRNEEIINRLNQGLRNISGTESVKRLFITYGNSLEDLKRWQSQITRPPTSG